MDGGETHSSAPSTPSDSAAAEPSVTVRTGPTLEQPNPRVPLARLLSFCAEVPVSGSVELTSANGRLTYALQGEAECHEVQLLGLRFDRTYCASLSLGADGFASTSADAGCFDTGPLPQPFPDTIVRAHDPARMQPGVTFFPLLGDVDYIVGITEQLEIAWLFEAPYVFVAEPLPDGTLLFQTPDEVVQQDLAGRVVRRFVSESSALPGVAVATQGFHHEAKALPNGTWASFSASLAVSTSYPRSYVDPLDRGPRRLSDATLLTWDASGAILSRLPMGPILDVDRIGYDALDTMPGEDLADWVHANAAQPAPDGDGWVISLRHQDAVIRVDGAGQLRWILGTPANWRGEHLARVLRPSGGGEFAYPYHQHAPELHPDGRLVLFDNGNNRASPFDGRTPLVDRESRSRPVIYRVDEAAMTLSQEWSYEEPIDGPVYSGARGDADLLANGNVLANYAFVSFQDGEPVAELGRGHRTVRLIEVVPGPDDPVMDIEFYSPGGSEQAGWRSYRAIRVPSPWPIESPRP